MKKKLKIVLFCSIVIILIVAITGSLFLTRQRTLSDVMQISEEDVYITRITTASTDNTPQNTYYSTDAAEVHALTELLSDTDVNFSGWVKTGDVYYVDNSTLYIISLVNGSDTFGWTISVSVDGVIYYGSHRYVISADQSQQFLAQLSDFCSTWERESISQ